MTDLVCSPNAALAYDYLVGKGLADFQAAAIIGNLQQESALNPRAFAPSEKAYGIAQWRLDRWDGLQRFAAARGVDPFDFNIQLEFVWQELSTRPELGLKRLLAAKSVSDAVVAFQDAFERCGTCQTPSRIAYAQGVLYACPGIRPPITAAASSKKSSTWKTIGILSVIGAVGYGAIRLLAAPLPERPQPFRRPPPEPFRRPRFIPPSRPNYDRYRP